MQINTSSQKLINEAALKQLEEALLMSEQRFHATFEQTVVGIAHIALDGGWLRVNKKFCNILGYSHEELLTLSLTDITHPDDIDIHLSSISQLLTGKIQTFSIEKRYIHKSGFCVWINLSQSLVLKRSGEPDYFIVTIEDISRRKAAQEALEKANEQLELTVEERTAELKNTISSLSNAYAQLKRQISTSSEKQHQQIILDAMPGMIWFKDRENRILKINKAAAAWMGMKVEDIEGRSTYDIYPAQAAKYHQNDLEVINSKKPRLGIIEKIKTYSGENIWLNLDRVPWHDGEGNIGGVVVFARDITAQKQAEEALLLLRKAVESSSDAIAMTDINGTSLYHNHAFINLFGYTVDELNNAGGQAIVYTDSLVVQEVFSTVMKGDSWRGEVEIKTKSDRIVPISLRADAIKDKTGKIIGVVCICNDITKRKHAESQLKQQATQLEQTVRELQQTQSQLIQTEKLSSLGQLVAGVAHEINNPVSFIHGNLPHVWDYAEDLLGLVTLYQQEYPNPTPEILDEIEAIDLNFIRSDLPKMLSSIKVGTQRICEIVRSLRNFSRLDEAMMKGVDLHEGIDSTLMILHNRLRASPDHPGIQVIKEYGKLPLVECYAGPLNQVFMNLIGNAIDALEELVASRQLSIVNGKIADNPQIRIHTEVIEKDKVSIRIYDNGSGMPESVRKRLFDPFFTTKAVGKGTGLGLSISHSIIVQKHGGNLSCISAPGEGTEFIIEIPIHQPNQEPPHVLDEAEI